MRIITHQQIEGVEPGETITVDADRGQWLIDNGYASEAPASGGRRKAKTDEPTEAEAEAKPE